MIICLVVQLQLKPPKKALINALTSASFRLLVNPTNSTVELLLLLSVDLTNASMGPPTPLGTFPEVINIKLLLPEVSPLVENSTSLPNLPTFSVAKTHY